MTSDTRMRQAELAVSCDWQRHTEVIIWIWSHSWVQTPVPFGICSVTGQVMLRAFHLFLLHNGYNSIYVPKLIWETAYTQHRLGCVGTAVSFLTGRTVPWMESRQKCLEMCEDSSHDPAARGWRSLLVFTLRSIFPSVPGEFWEDLTVHFRILLS